MEYYYKSIDNYEILDLYMDKPYFSSWLEIVKPVLESREFQKRRLFFHHENECLWTHLIKVSYYSYIYAKKHKLNEYDCAIAGILHDFYKEAWHDSPGMNQLEDKYTEKLRHPRKLKLREMHGFIHPIEALDNSREYFPELLNKRIENAIVTHMFPFSLVFDEKLPKYKESLAVWYIDKKISWTNLPTPKNTLKYIGIKEKKKETK